MSELNVRKTEWRKRNLYSAMHELGLLMISNKKIKKSSNINSKEIQSIFDVCRSFKHRKYNKIKNEGDGRGIYQLKNFYNNMNDILNTSIEYDNITKNLIDMINPDECIKFKNYTIC